MRELARGTLRKMRTELQDPVQYRLPLGDQEVALNEWIGATIRLEYHGEIHCIHCGRKTRKSYNQGYCFPCCRDLARCDQCIVKPEKCHFHLGTCREPDWGEANCNIDHFVYLANTAGIKVGITRHTQVPTRWIDQGAIQALPVCRVASRRISGLLEVALTAHLADKTNWRALLREHAAEVDLAKRRDALHGEMIPEIEALQAQFGLQALQWLDDAQETRIRYPIETYPGKIQSLKFDKVPVIEARLRGIKGQYLFFDHGAINLRSHGGYLVSLHTE